MGDGNLMDPNFGDLDLNQDPIDPPLPSIGFNEFETGHMAIEERIRRLEAVTARTRQHQRAHREENPVEISRRSDQNFLNIDAEGGVIDGTSNNIDAEGGVIDGTSNADLLNRTAEKGKGCKRDRSHLVAKALEMESEVKKVDKEGGSFYDCNICLDLAKDPILTCCGHLFCWSCFYQVSDVDSTSKECPVCKGEVSDSTIIPIYGNGDTERVCETVNGLRIPPRPKARRVESVRQQQMGRGLSHVPVAEALRRIRMSIGGSDADNHLREPTEAAGSRHIRIHQVSRVLSESAASLTSLSSALSNAERLVEDLETVINNRLPRSDPPSSSIDIGNRIIMHSAGLQSNIHLPDLTADLSAALPSTSSLQSTDASSSAVHTSARGGIGPPVAPRYSLRRRNVVSRTPDGDRQDNRESRRRR